MRKQKINDYSEQYKNPKWQKLRLKILERDNWACQRCGDDESQLQVHHRCYIYGNKTWEYHELDLVTLCNDCHKEEKDGMGEEMGSLTQVLRRKLFSNHVNEINCSLGAELVNENYPTDLFISALSWIIIHRFDENIMTPYIDYLTVQDNKRRALCGRET